MIEVFANYKPSFQSKYDFLIMKQAMRLGPNVFLLDGFN